MATIVGDIAISVGADIGPLVTDLARGQAAVSRFGSSAQASATGGMRAFAVAAGAIAGAATAAGLGLLALTRRSMENIDAVSKSARMLGIHTASLQAMAQVANEAGVETDGLVKAMVKMQNNIDGLSQGTAAQVAAFERLGLSAKELAGLKADEQFAMIGEAINAIEDPSARTAAALDIFGKAGAELITMFEGYRGAVADAAKFQRDFNIAVSDVDGKQIEAANDAVGRLQVAFTGLGNALAVKFAPGIAAAAVALADLIITTDSEIKGMALDLSFEKISSSIDGVTESAELMAASFATFQGGAASAGLTEHVQKIRDAKQAFDDGTISVEEYEKRVATSVGVIRQMMAVLGLVADVDMSDASAEMDRLAEAIERAFGAAKVLSGTLPNIQPLGPSGMESDRRGRVYTRSDLAPTQSSRPGRRGVDSETFSDGEAQGGGGGGGRSLADDLEAMRASFQSQAELAEEQYQEQLDRLREFREAKLLTEEEYNAMEAQLKADHADQMSAIDAYRYGDGLQKAGAFFGDMASAMQSGNEKMQKISRTFGAAEALINAYRAANQTMADPTLPFFAKIPAMMSVLSAGMNVVSAIRSGSSSAAGGRAAVPASAASAPASPLEVRLTGFGPSDIFTGGMIGGLLDKLSAEAGDRGYKIMVAA